jgi:hypothetical protein
MDNRIRTPGICALIVILALYVVGIVVVRNNSVRCATRKTPDCLKQNSFYASA